MRGALRLAAVDEVGAKGGLTRGMTLADARVLVPDLRTADMDREADARALHACALACERFTPLVALSGEDGLLLDVTGCAHLFGGEDALRARARGLFVMRGLATRAAAASTPHAARALAVYGPARAVRAEDVSALPLAALDMREDILVALGRSGLRTLGELEARPREVLAARFGLPLVRALDRLFGREDTRITPLRPPAAVHADLRFPEPLTATEGLFEALATLAAELGRALEARGEGGRAFEAGVFRTDGASRRVGIETARPTRDPAALMRLLRLRLESLPAPLDPGFGFDAVRLSVLRSEPLAPSQTSLAGSSRAEGSLTGATLAGGTLAGGSPAGVPEAPDASGEWIDRLVARFGAERVLSFALRDTHDPLRAGSVRPRASASAAARSPAPAPAPRFEAGAPPERPLTVFEPPRLIEALAEVPDGPPLRFRWRRILHEVARAEGPERIEPEWWRTPADGPGLRAARDYYRVEDADGRRFWIYREGAYGEDSPPRWFLHGLFA